MPTKLQIKATDALVKMSGGDMRKVGGKVGPAMINGGYAPATAKTPKKLTESIGYKLVLTKYGLTDGLVIKALVADIKKKPQKRVSELSLGADILRLRGVKDEKDLPPSELHLHLHQSPKVVQIIKSAEEALLAELTDENKNA